MRIIGCCKQVFIAFLCIHFCCTAGQTNFQDAAVLKSLTDGWKNLPHSWTGEDPCGKRWEGITCSKSRIVTITLASMDLTGQLTGDLESLSELQILDLSYNKGITGSLPPSIGKLSKLTTLILLGCGFSGSIPNSVGSLKKLVYLSLNSNRFTGEVPASIGSLRQLYWLDLSDNQLTGSIPVSDGSKPGLDLLVNTKHFHFGKNRLSGEIPRNLFNSNMTLIHVLFDNNRLTGSIPESLGLVHTLQAVRFDRNLLSGAVPPNLNDLIGVSELMLSNNALTGPVPNLTGMVSLISVDLSNNSFEATTVPHWFSALKSLKTVIMERTGLEGLLPSGFFSIPQLETVILKSNQLNGTLDIGGSSSQLLKFIDLQNNSISNVKLDPGKNYTLMLSDNPFCQKSLVASPYCNKNLGSSSYKTPVFCVTPKCASGQMSSPTCKCAYPYTGTFVLRAPSFSTLGNDAYFTELQLSLLQFFVDISLPVDSVSLSNAAMDSFGYLNMHLAFFPAKEVHFNRTAVSTLAFVLSNQTYTPKKQFKPYVFFADNYTPFAGSKKPSHIGAIIGAVMGVSILLLLSICAAGYAFSQKKRAEKANQQANPFVSWDSQGTSGDVPKLKGARFFTFDEVQKSTNNFSEINNVGSGGYGKVYRGVLTDGEIVAIKRSQQGSMQGSREFKNEIELLSRVHHKNLVKLIGFCFDHGEQMLVYEFIPNGTLLDSLSGKSGIELDWIRRLKGYVTTQVKGTMGYLDPEYFMTNQLTDKSDIFGFGVVLLEMLTARKPIQQGKFIVKVMKETVDKSKDLYNLGELIDPMLLSSSNTLLGFEKFVDLTLKCVEEFGVDRPSTGEVVKELEIIMQLAGFNPDTESTTTSQSYQGSNTKSFSHPYSDDSLV
ncbi:hypothetical protein SOVF_149010 [Spinacia oleracea]|nr:hypothetical protein SOVF_149010 [Spinacia oleracea]